MELTAEAIMSHPVICAREGMTVRELIDLLQQKQISGLPVVDADDRLVGVISITDLISLGVDSRSDLSPVESDFHTSPAMDGLAAATAFLEPEDEILDSPIRNLMSRNIITTSEKSPLGELAGLMISHHIHRLIVVRGEKIVGIVSVRDILRALRDRYRTDA
jgi:predicted transcriptional regulator